MRKYLVSAALLAALLPATASAVVYTTDTVTYTGLGDQIGSGFDIVTLGTATGDYTGPGTYVVNNIAFTAGVNTTSSTPYTLTGTLTGSGNAGFAFTYPVAYSLDINSFDTLTLGGNYFVVSGVGLHVNTLVLTSGGETSLGQLTATVGPIPEPATWGLMIVGFAMVGIAARRRATPVTA